MKEPAHFRARDKLVLTLKRTLINCNQEASLKSRTYGFDAACDCQLSRHSYYYSHSGPYIASYVSIFLASGQKKPQGEKTQEFKNSRKKLKLKPNNKFSHNHKLNENFSKLKDFAQTQARKLNFWLVQNISLSGIWPKKEAELRIKSFISTVMISTATCIYVV